MWAIEGTSFDLSLHKDEGDLPNSPQNKSFLTYPTNFQTSSEVLIQRTNSRLHPISCSD